MYIVYIALLLIASFPCAYAKDKISTGVIFCIILASFVGLLLVIYAVYRLVKCSCRTRDRHEDFEPFLFLKYGAV